MNAIIWKLMPLLFGSGMSALAYQLVWIREFRLVFGASTLATSAVLAVFMGGLGLGSSILGNRVQRHRNPLLLYGTFELIIALSASLTPFMIVAVETIYLKIGGSQVFGHVTGTLVRILFAFLVLGIPTFFMGGTLPALAKTAQRKIDLGRRDLGFLYGLNTLGAVAGVILVVFILLEQLGARRTLWLAATLNLLVAVFALAWAKAKGGNPDNEAAPPAAMENQVGIPGRDAPLAPRNFVFTATFIAGFCFFLMELVWSRMLSPLLGGTTYTMGIILSVALFGLAVGGWGYGVRRYTMLGSLRILALISALEALAIAVPYALGDQIAVLASLLRPIGTVGMKGYAVGWFCVTAIIVLPAAVTAGYQFPLLIGLTGRGRNEVASQTGSIYAWNTLGAILGMLAGGIILLPGLGALFCWRATIILLVLLAASSLLLGLRNEKRDLFSLVPVILLGLTLFMASATGPTAFWRHSPIGAGRLDLASASRNEIQSWINNFRRQVYWEKDGREASIAIQAINGLAFIMNGKSDGNAKKDAGTQVMAPLISAILHPAPRKALVLGLGTGSSSGWLAAIDGMERVDTIEIEPAMLEMAKVSAPVNRDVLNNPKSSIILGDAREILMTSREAYDLIFSEPSNPYRAGISSLYTREFYQAAAARLSKHGYFSQWVQGYEVDTRTIKIIYTTLSEVFPVIETWETMNNDLLFVCSFEKTDYSVPRLRERIKEEPFRSALLNVWGVTDLEGLFSHYVAKARLAEEVVKNTEGYGLVNTDDLMLVEFGFARTLGKGKLFNIMDIRNLAELRNEDHPDFHDGALDWVKVAVNDHNRFTMQGLPIPLSDVHRSTSEIFDPKKELYHHDALNFFLEGDTPGVTAAWRYYNEFPQYPIEQTALAEALADEGHSLAEQYINRLRGVWPGTAEAIAARYHWRKGQAADAMASLRQAVDAFRADPWTNMTVMSHTLILMKEMAANNRELALHCFNLLSEPFSVGILEEERLLARVNISARLPGEYGRRAVDQFEPYPLWEEQFLQYRLQKHLETQSPSAQKAEDDLNSFRRHAPQRFTIEYIPSIH